MIISDCISTYAQARVVNEVQGHYDWDHGSDAWLAEGSPDVLVMWAARRGYSLTYRHGSACPDHPDDGLTFTLEPIGEKDE